MQQTMNVTIAGMHCAACVKRVTRALQAVPGAQVKSVEVGSAQIAFDPGQTAAPEVLAAVNRIGFLATVKD